MTLSFLYEELTPKEENDADKMRISGHEYYLERFIKSHPKAAELFEKYPDPSRVKFRARIPVSFEEKVTDPHPAVVSFLTNSGYTFTDDDYKKGVAHSTKTVGNPEKGIPYSTKKVSHKIGGLLDKHGASDDIKKNFMNDPYRIGAKTKSFDLVITANHRDVYAGSTGRGWTSCADKRPRKPGDPRGAYDGKGPAALVIPKEIEHHTHMAYLLPTGGNLETDAIGRISFKKYHGLLTGHDTLIPESGEYGTPPKEFMPAAHKVMGLLFHRNPDEIYAKNREVYHDGSPMFIMPEGGIRPEHIDAAFKFANSKSKAFATEILNEKYVNQIYKHIDPNAKYNTKKAREIARNILDFKNTVDGLYSKDAPEDIIHHIIGSASDLENTSVSPWVSTIAENPHVKEAIHKASKLFNIDNRDHVSALMLVKSNKPVSRELLRGMTENLSAKNYTQFKHIAMLRARGMSFDGERAEKIPLHPNHNMGPDVFHHLVKSASDSNELAPSMFKNIYMSMLKANKTNGNIYDHAIQFEREGIPGMTKALHDYVSDIVSTSRRHSGEVNYDRLGSVLYRTKPENRQRLADAFNLGLDHNEIMRLGKSGVDNEIKLDQLNNK